MIDKNGEDIYRNFGIHTVHACLLTAQEYDLVFEDLEKVVKKIQKRGVMKPPNKGSSQKQSSRAKKWRSLKLSKEDYVYMYIYILARLGKRVDVSLNWSPPTARQDRSPHPNKGTDLRPPFLCSPLSC